MADLHWFLGAFGAITRHGAQGFMAMRGIQRLDPEFIEAMETFEGELDRLEHAAAVEDADRTRERMRKAL